MFTTINITTAKKVAIIIVLLALVVDQMLLRRIATSIATQRQPARTFTAKMADTKRTKPIVLPGSEDWEAAWSAGLSKGMRWDIGKCEPELEYELGLGEKGTLAPLFRAPLTEKRGLVPGCGRGYAVAAMAKAGIKAIGLDLSPSAVKEATAESSHPLAQFVEGNFFEAEGLGQFDLIFDSTFLCAISPQQWRQWAKTMNELIKPGGSLALQVFPVFVDEAFSERDPDHPGDEPGPPNRLTINLVRKLLSDYPFKEVAFRETPVERNARGDFQIRSYAVKEYWMVFLKQATA